ncbi:hypothetical protein YPPY66_4961, partial [Yersinia pestis PY-66]
AITTEPDHRTKNSPPNPHDSVYLPKLTLLFAKQAFIKIIICKNNSVPTYIQAIWSAKFQPITAQQAIPQQTLLQQTIQITDNREQA